MKTAREMFEELGYIDLKEYNNKYFSNIESIKNYGIIEGGKIIEEIIFWSPDCIDTDIGTLSIDLLKAIIKQCEELGWKI